MPANVTGHLISSGKSPTNRTDFQSVQGIGFVCVEQDRPEHIAQRGDPNEKRLEATPAGVQRPDPRWVPEFVKAVSSTTGLIPIADYLVAYRFKSSRYTDLESNPGSAILIQATDIAPAWVQNTAYAVGDIVTAPVGTTQDYVDQGGGPAKRYFTVPAGKAHTSTNSGTAAEDFDTDYSSPNSRWVSVETCEFRLGEDGFIEPADNGVNTSSWADDYVDIVEIGRTLADDVDVADIGDTTRTIDATTTGTYYPVKEVPLNSFRDYTVANEWTNNTRYELGDIVYAPDTSNLFKLRFRCRLAHRSSTTGDLVQGTTNTSRGKDNGTVTEINGDTVAGVVNREDLWDYIGIAPVTIGSEDAEIDKNEPFSVRREVPPDCWSMAIVGGRAYFTGQRDYTLGVSVTNGSRVVDISAAAVPPGNIVPTGIVGRGFQVSNDAGFYTVTDWVSKTRFLLDRDYEGVTQTAIDCIVRGQPGILYFSEQEGGVPLADHVPRDNAVVFRPESVLGNECVVQGREGGFVIAPDAIGWFTQPLEQPSLIEEATFRTESSRGVAVGNRGEVFVMCDDGIRMYDGPQPGRLISEPVRDWWFPRQDTQYHWNRSLLGRCVLVYHPSLHWLIVLAPLWNDGFNRGIGLVYDMDNQNPAHWAWSRLRLWGDTPTPIAQTNPQKVYPDITAATTKTINGRSEVILGGSMRIDSDGDGTDEAFLIGRMWLFNAVDGPGKVYLDQIPQDKVDGATVTEILNHGIPFNNVHRPIAGTDGQRISVNKVRVVNKPVKNSQQTYRVRARVQQDWNGEITQTEFKKVSNARSSNAVDVRANRAHRVMTEVYGTVRQANDVTQIEEIHQFARSVGKGSRR